ncbi:MAG: ATP-binding cassette domain-containing protein [Tissierellia bacterium]|nr:ATP-binding cassette domain-containing protein [Tissierellia bacterium]
MVKLDNVSVSFQKVILKNVTLRINQGECVLFAGESGSGKSTILKLVNGLIPHFETAKMTGSVQVCGKENKAMELFEISRFISSVFQNPKTSFFNTNTTQELLFYLENYGKPRELMKERLEKAKKNLSH